MDRDKLLESHSNGRTSSGTDAVPSFSELQSFSRFVMESGVYSRARYRRIGRRFLQRPYNHIRRGLTHEADCVPIDLDYDAERTGMG